MTPFLSVIGLSLIGSVGAVVLSGMLFQFPAFVRVAMPCLISYSAGTLLGAALLGLIPHALEHAPAERVMPTVLAGLVGIFLLEKVFLYRHCHEGECEEHGAGGPLILLGDTVHNFLDGVVIAGAYLTSPALGLSAALSAALHEIPQEVGDFAVLLHSGYSRRRAFALNVFSGLGAAFGATFGYFFVSAVAGATPYLLATAAAVFLYVALSDLVPELHRHRTRIGGAGQIALMVLGILTIAWVDPH